MGTPCGGVGGDTSWWVVGDTSWWGKWGHLVVGYGQGILPVVYCVNMLIYCLFVYLETGEHRECR